MRWDIDKALRALEAEGISGVLIRRTTVDSEAHLKRMGLKPSGEVSAWSLRLGAIFRNKATYYGWTIREAYLKARKAIRRMSEQECRALGLRKPKHSNSYMAARQTQKKRAV